MTSDFYDKLDSLYQAGDLDAVEVHLSEQLQFVADSSGENSLAYAAVLNELASYLRGVSRYEDSEKALKHALTIMRQNDADKSTQYATMLLNLAGLYRLMGKPQAAITLFLESKQLLIDVGETDDYAYASVLNNLSLAYQDGDDLPAALTAALDAYELIKMLGTGDHELATSLSNLAVISIRLGDALRAEEFIDQALSIYAQMPEENVHHAAALSTKATLLFRVSRYSEALTLFQKALNLTERFFGNNIEYAAGERHIAMSYEALGDLEPAIVHYQTAVSNFMRILGSSHPRTLECQAQLHKLITKGQHP